MNAKKVIKGIAKTTGKYTLKGLGKGVELAGRGAIQTVNALVENPQVQKIATGAGILASSVMIPTVGVGLMSTLGLKYMIDKSLLGNDKGIVDEIDDILNAGAEVTKNVAGKISPALQKADKGVQDVGKNYQDKIDNIFR
jgi:hypothetical protein